MRTEEQSAPSGNPEHGTIEVPHGGAVKPHSPAHTDAIHLPRPTAWPIVTALGFTLLIAGILTHYVISILGFLMLCYGCVGWFKEVLPHEMHEEIDVRVQEIAIATSRKSVARISVGDNHRAHVPVESFSVLAGLKGGLAGGAAMILPAIAYGLIAHHSIWYPVNLLGGAGVASVSGIMNPTEASLRAFHFQTLGIAAIIHVISCTLIGLVYGSVLPLAPKHPIILGGVLAPLAWTGLLFATLPTINPEMSSRINWPDFVIAQITFGVVAGWVVSRSAYFRTAQSLPFAMRLGLETPGMGHDDAKDGK